MELYANNTGPDFSTINDPIELLILLSQFYGGEPRFVIAGGGNTSVKVRDRLFVKASGITLSGIEADGFVEMRRDPLDALLGTLDPDEEDSAREERYKNAVMAARVYPEKGQRPSVECVLHNLLPGRFVAHTHCTVINTITCAIDGEAITRELYGDNVVWIPYTTPGFVLGKALEDTLRNFTSRYGHPYPDGVVMGNHGLIVCGETPNEVIDTTARVCAKALEKVGNLGDMPFGAMNRMDSLHDQSIIEQFSAALSRLVGDAASPKHILFDNGPIIAALSGGEDGQETVLKGPVTPDQIVYCKFYPLWFPVSSTETWDETFVRLRNALGDYQEEHGFTPPVVLIEGLGMFCLGDSVRGAETVRNTYTDIALVMGGARKIGGIRYMTISESEFIENWEVEHYRRQVSADTL